MKIIKARALVLREYEAGESDKRLLILAKEHGRLLVRARGARKPKSKYLAASQLFTYADYVLAEGRGFLSLTQADILEGFYELRKDYDRLHAAHVIAEVCEKAVPDNINCDDLLLLTLTALTRLAKGDMPLLVQNVFFLRFFDAYGLRPTVESAADGRVFLGGETIFGPFSRDAGAAMQHVLTEDLRGAFRFAASGQVLMEIDRAARELWNAHFDRELLSMSYK